MELTASEPPGSAWRSYLSPLYQAESLNAEKETDSWRSHCLRRLVRGGVLGGCSAPLRGWIVLRRCRGSVMCVCCVLCRVLYGVVWCGCGVVVVCGVVCGVWEGVWEGFVFCVMMVYNIIYNSAAAACGYGLEKNYAKKPRQRCLADFDGRRG